MGKAFSVLRSAFQSPGEAGEKEFKWLEETFAAAARDHRAVLFSKDYCPYCDKCKKVLSEVGCDYVCYELDLMGQPRNGPVQQALKAKYSNELSCPQLFAGNQGDFLGTFETVRDLQKAGELRLKLEQHAVTFSQKVSRVVHAPVELL
eukprot:TRINITY_DN48088_c0_g1_i1.p1 TRINITY_DN48088_c0_g1~~TRINITY_DN48088_c0_g1_i1.p1  ORF type:complete len:148 (-),score=40.86 TRINITY_DN48088_c0_g1_i1:150-593(-)